MKKKACCVPAEKATVESISNRMQDEELARLAWAVAHPARVRIVRILLARRACICGEIVDELPLAQSTVSQHLKILKESGLIQGVVDGPKVCYCINADSLARLKGLIAEL